MALRILSGSSSFVASFAWRGNCALGNIG